MAIIAKVRTYARSREGPEFDNSLQVGICLFIYLLYYAALLIKFVYYAQFVLKKNN